jgi:hypothetical protein
VPEDEAAADREERGLGAERDRDEDVRIHRADRTSGRG